MRYIYILSPLISGLSQEVGSVLAGIFPLAGSHGLPSASGFDTSPSLAK